MAIRMMVNESKAGQPNVETVTNYPGSETWRISHHYDCPHRNSSERGPGCTSCSNFSPLYIETSHVGCVLDTYERNGYDDSDFHAIVWDESEQMVKDIQYATTRGWSYPNGASVDATPEVKAKADAYQANCYFRKWQENNEKQASMPYKDREVKVIAGRKIPIGVEGTVFWFGEDSYKKARRSRYNRYNPYADLVGKFNKENFRIGIKWFENGVEKKEFTSADNVEVINPSRYLESESEGYKVALTNRGYRGVII